MKTESSLTEYARNTSKRTGSWLGWCCAAAIIIAVVLGYFIFRAPDDGAAASYDWLLWVMVLVCPLMHFFMHRGHGKVDKRDAPSGNGAVDER